MDDWKVGDLALCVAAHPLYPKEVQPGTLHVVEWIWELVDIFNCDHADLGFDFVGIDRIEGDIAYWRGNFRKVTPREADEFDCEVIDLMTKQPAEVR